VPRDQEGCGLVHDVVVWQELARLRVGFGQHAGRHVLDDALLGKWAATRRGWVDLSLARSRRRRRALERASALASKEALLVGDDGFHLRLDLGHDSLGSGQLSRHQTRDRLGGLERSAKAADALLQPQTRFRKLLETVEEAAGAASQARKITPESNLPDDVEGVAAQERVQVDGGAGGALLDELLLEHRRRFLDHLKVLLHAPHRECGQQHAGSLVVDGLVVIRGEEALPSQPLADGAVLEETLLEHVRPLEQLAEQLRVGQHHGAAELGGGQVDEPGWDLEGEEAAVLRHKARNVLVKAAIRTREIAQIAEERQRRRAARDRDDLG